MYQRPDHWSGWTAYVPLPCLLLLLVVLSPLYIIIGCLIGIGAGTQGGICHWWIEVSEICSLLRKRKV